MQKQKSVKRIIVLPPIMAEYVSTEHNRSQGKNEYLGSQSGTDTP